MKNEEFPCQEELKGTNKKLCAASSEDSSSRREATILHSSLKEKTARGLFWGGISNGVQQLLNLLFGIFLARLLTPDDYGMVAVLSIFSLVASSLQESGFTAALVNKKDAGHCDYNAVFWFNVGLGTCLYWLLFWASPFIARFYGNPELTPLARYSFLGFWVSSCGIAHNAYLFRHLMTRQKAIASMLSLFVSGCTGVTLAYCGFAYWGIATQTLVYISVQTACYWYFSPWRPTFRFDFSPLRQMFGFSFKLLLTNIFNHLNNSLLSIVLGKLYSEREVGYYSQGNKWSGMGQLCILGMINGVAQPVLAGVSDDAERQRRVFRKLLRFVAFVSFPALLGLALVAQELTVIAVTDKWLPSVPFLQMMCVSGAFVPIVGLYQQFIISQGRSDVFMWNIILSGLVLLACVLLAHPWGIKAIVWAYVVVCVGWLPVWHRLAWRGKGLSWWLALRDMAPYAVVSVGVMLITHILTVSVDNIYLRLSVKIAIAVLLYIGIMWVAGVSTLREAWGYFRKKQVV
nr:lipopolysaccharide biosynthesis protein [Bacteroides sp. ET71]